MATLSARQIAALIKINPGPWNTKGKQVMAVAGALAESGGRTTVYNGICCFGLWQVNLSAHMSKIPGRSREAKIRYLKTAMGNLRVAQKIYVEAGHSWGPWEAITNGSYRRYLADATRAVGGVSLSPAAIQAVQAGNVSDPDWPDWLDPRNLPNPLPNPDIPGLDIPNPFGIPGEIFDELSTFFGTIANAISWVFDPHNWIRIGAFVGGGVLVITFVYALINNSDLGDSLKEIAMLAATKGRAAGARFKGAGKAAS